VDPEQCGAVRQQQQPPCPCQRQQQQRLQSQRQPLDLCGKSNVAVWCGWKRLLLQPSASLLHRVKVFLPRDHRQFSSAHRLPVLSAADGLLRRRPAAVAPTQRWAGREPFGSWHAGAANTLHTARKAAEKRMSH